MVAARAGADMAGLQALNDAIMDRFQAAGALRVDPAVLQPADVLLDLYGEDIRARAYTTWDSGGEKMLRPDFTVPVVQRHMAVGAEPARYAYTGPVWRKQNAGSQRAAEFIQAGFELFDGRDAAAADAEVFALISEVLAGTSLVAETGDLGILLAAIDGLETAPHRRAALRRHVWRPTRFHRLLERFGAGQSERMAGKAELLDAWRDGRLDAVLAASGQQVGLRSEEEIATRVALLASEADTPPVSGAQIDLIEAILAQSGSCSTALSAFQEMQKDIPALRNAVDAFDARLAALETRGVDTSALSFRGEFGRTTMEYYDGFVFGFFAPERPDLPVIASGGRYDALTRVLGGGTGIPAVGAIIRPEALLALKGVTC